jgi:hypothetical protein
MGVEHENRLAAGRIGISFSEPRHDRNAKRQDNKTANRAARAVRPGKAARPRSIRPGRETLPRSARAPDMVAMLGDALKRVT